MRIRNANVLRNKIEIVLRNDGTNQIVKAFLSGMIDIIDELPENDVVPLEDHEALSRRFRHLMSSEYIASFDAVDHSGKYKRDISEAGKHAGRDCYRVWNAVRKYDDGKIVLQCPACGFEWLETYIGERTVRKCPCCGLNMDGGGDRMRGGVSDG